MVITSKYKGTCKSCGGSIRRGEKIDWSKGSGARHIDCAEGSQGRSVEYRFSSGATMYQNSNGRCEDAPCCGCCT